MKRLLISLLFLSSCIYASPQSIKVEVDEIHELNSIVWRLAGAEEYSQCYIPGYADDIDNYFDGYKEHPLIAYCNELRDELYISHDAVYRAGTFIEKSGDGIGLCEGYTYADLAGIDGRWTAEAYEKYVNLLDDFYGRSKFDSFFDAHKPLYDDMSAKLDSIVKNKVDLAWIEGFFGQRLPEMRIFISPNNGPSNYGLNLNVPPCRRGILIGVHASPDGRPTFSRMIVETIIHEVAHMYTNPLVDAYSDRFAAHIDMRLYGYAMNTFYEYGVGTDSLLYEWLTRLCVLYYQKQHGDNSVPIEYHIGSELKKGFIWMDNSFNLLDSLMNGNKGDKHIGDFMPALIDDLNETAENLGDVIAEYESGRPRIVEVIPTPGAELDLSGDFVTFTIVFSEDMYTNASGLQMLLENFAPTKCNGGIDQGWKDACTFQMTYPTECVKDARIYGFVLNRDYMQDIYGFPMKGENTFVFSIPEDSSCK